MLQCVNLNLEKMETLKDTKFVTDLERQVIQNIIDSEYMDATGEQWLIGRFGHSQ